jgi:predicted DNA-binding transcriptional regulator AlpA
MATKKNKLTDKQKTFLAVFEKNSTNVSNACGKVGIARKTFYEWCNTSDIFSQKVDEAKEAMVDFAESSLYKQIKDGNTSATIFFLKTQAKDRGYVERQDIDAKVTNVPTMDEFYDE